MLTRVGVAIIGLGIVLPILFWGGQLGFDLLVSVALLIGAWEYSRMALPNEIKLGFLLIGGMLIGELVMARMHPHSLGMVFPIFLIIIMISQTMRASKGTQGALDRLGRYILGLLWISGLISLVLLRQMDGGLNWIYVAVVGAWTSDSGGYLAGVSFGRHLLHPSVSPKKTWEGVVGSVCLGIVGMFALRGLGVLSVTPSLCVLLGSTLAIMGILGDLAQSLIKRSQNVKDMGRIMPGHGGILDRVDSLLFIGPVLYLGVWVLGA